MSTAKLLTSTEWDSFSCCRLCFDCYRAEIAIWLLSIDWLFFFFYVGKFFRTPCPLLGGDRVVSDSNQLKPHGGLSNASQKWPGFFCEILPSCKSGEGPDPPRRDGSLNAPRAVVVVVLQPCGVQGPLGTAAWQDSVSSSYPAPLAPSRA